ncbi:hypothetical protein M409DRAFT_26988 [Zasmidium cellare ATCC 36951]|uniref:Uncharacterized protein n=1 Tax=Zasmidium cellare ATCC 36951 TaxID=1080233 RepID=A0A6A6C935_ZASCE|nr:uncharacterized protein M409DRAFT_26988 [Zasmidium cellare ATCC 36951]KAF2162750.1 hypothetical protein M409DRAFT_26988 [Zasmidium cellare ATCC 36951]
MASPFRLLDLATELQDMIEELHFSSHVFVISDATPNPPYLEVLRTRKDQEKYRRAKETCYKHAAFQVGEFNLEAFVQNAQPHVRHIEEIRMDGISIKIDPFVKRPKVSQNLMDTSPFEYLLYREEAVSKAIVGRMRLKADEAELRKYGLLPFTLKIEVKVMDGGNVAWSKWVHGLDLEATVKTALDLANFTFDITLDITFDFASALTSTVNSHITSAITPHHSITMAKSDGQMTCRLLALPQELQDHIQELVFTDVAVVTPKGIMHPLLVALAADKAIHRRAKETCFKHAIFKMRVERIRPFLEQNKEYLPLITTIDIVPPNLDSPHVLCVPQAKQLPGEATDVLDVLDMLDNEMALRAVREATTPQKMAFFADLEREVEEMGGRKGVLKIAVVIRKAEEQNRVVRTLWTSRPTQDVTRFLQIAGYHHALMPM